MFSFNLKYSRTMCRLCSYKIKPDFYKKRPLLCNTYCFGFLHNNLACFQTSPYVIYPYKMEGNDDSTELPSNLMHLVKNLNFNLKNCNRIYKSDIERILEDAVSEGRLTQNEGILLLQSCGDLIIDQLQSDRVKLIWKIWNTYKKRDTIDLPLYHALLTALSMNGEPINSEKTLKEIIEQGFKPTEVTYSLLLSCLCESGDMENALKLLDIMKTHRIPLGNSAFNSLAFLFAKHGDMENALNILKRMKSGGIRATSKTYTNLLRGAAESSNEENFNKVWNLVGKSGVTFSTSEILSIIYSLSKQDLHWLIPIVLGDVENWKTELPSVINFCVHMLYSKMYKTAFMVLNAFNNYLLIVHDSKSYADYVVEEMIKSATPIEDVIKFCNDLSDRHRYILLVAGYAALSNFQQDESYKIFHAMKDNEFPIRPHYFWPLIISAAKHTGEQGVLSVLSKMGEYGIRADFETLDNYAFLYMDVDNPHILVRKLQDRGFLVSSVITPLLSRYVKDLKLKKALETCKLFPSKVYFGYFDRYLALACLRTKDVKSTVMLIQQLGNDDSPTNFITSVLKQNKSILTPEILKDIVKEFQNINAQFGWSVIENIRNYMRRQGLEESEEEFLTELMNDLHTKDDKPEIPHPSDMDLTQLEDHLTQLKSKSMNTRGIIRRLLIMYCGLGNIQRVRELLEEIKKNKYEMSAGMKASLIEVFSRHDDPDNALRFLNSLKEEVPDFKIDSFKYVNLAIAFAKKGDFAKAMSILPEQKEGMDTNMVTKRCWVLLNTVAENCAPNETRQMLDRLVSYKYCKYNNQLLGPLIRSYFARDDIDGAVNEFVQCSKQYSVAPLKFELLCRLIPLQEIDEEKYRNQLEKVFQACYAVSGVDSTYVCYITALAEMNKLKELQKFLLDSHLAVNIKVLNRECDHLSDKNKLHTLLNLAKVFKQFPRLDASNIYLNILKIYSRNGDYESGLKLLYDIEETGVMPSDEFYSLLSSLLLSNKQEVPFKM